MDVDVEVSRDETGELLPRRLRLGEELVEVEVLDRWPGEDHLYVKVRASSGARYTLRFDRGQERWELHAYAADGDVAEDETLPVTRAGGRGRRSRR